MSEEREIKPWPITDRLIHYAESHPDNPDEPIHEFPEHDEDLIHEWEHETATDPARRIPVVSRQQAVDSLAAQKIDPEVASAMVRVLPEHHIGNGGAVIIRGLLRLRPFAALIERSHRGKIHVGFGNIVKLNPNTKKDQ